MIHSKSMLICKSAQTKIRAHRPLVHLPQPESLECFYDAQMAALWISLRANCAYCVTKALLREFNEVGYAISRWPKGLIDFKILQSKLAGVFSLGGDLEHFINCICRKDKEALLRYGNDAIEAIWHNLIVGSQNHATSIAIVEGEAQGGGFEAALSCHLLIAERGTHFGFPESLFGLFPGMGAFHLLAARSDAGLARKLMSSANRYPAEMLHEAGIVDVVAEKGRGAETARDIIANATPEWLGSLRKRFASLELDELKATVSTWVDCALTLNEKALRSMNYLLSAQKARATRMAMTNKVAENFGSSAEKSGPRKSDSLVSEVSATMGYEPQEQSYETTPPQSFSGLQSEGGDRRHQG